MYQHIFKLHFQINIHRFRQQETYSGTIKGLFYLGVQYSVVLMQIKIYI